MQFDLTIEFNNRIYRFKVEQSKPSKGFEQFILTGGDRTVVLQSNRPMLLARGLKKKPITWKVLSGEVKSEKALELAIKSIEKYLKDQAVVSKPVEAPKESKEIRPTMFAKTSRQKAKESPPVIPWIQRLKNEGEH